MFDTCPSPAPLPEIFPSRNVLGQTTVPVAPGRDGIIAILIGR